LRGRTDNVAEEREKKKSVFEERLLFLLLDDRR
jgi:hypothetical protein